MSEDRDLNRKGRKDSWGHTRQPLLLGQIQQAASPGSKQIQLIPGSGTGSAQPSRAPSPHQCPSPQQGLTLPAPGILSDSQ